MQATSGTARVPAMTPESSVDLVVKLKRHMPDSEYGVTASVVQTPEWDLSGDLYIAGIVAKTKESVTVRLFWYHTVDSIPANGPRVDVVAIHTKD